MYECELMYGLGVCYSKIISSLSAALLQVLSLYRLPVSDLHLYNSYNCNCDL